MKNENENNLPDMQPETFAVPEGYFQRSAQVLLHKIDWYEEHKNYSRLMKLKDGAVFAVPSDYFTGAGVNSELTVYSALKKTGKNSGFHVPGGYFENLETSMLSDLFHERVSDFDNSERLDSCPRVNSFHVPEAYFGTQARDVQRILSPASPKIISLFTKRLVFSVAALLLLVLGVWVYTLYFINTAQEVNCRTIACLDKADLTKAKHLETFEDDELYELVDPSLLERKLQTAETNKKITDGDAEETEELPEEI